LTIQPSDIVNITQNVTKSWTRQRKAEVRCIRGIFSRGQLFGQASRVTYRAIMEEFLPAAYAHASGQGRYTVSKRQLFYGMRKHFLQWIGRDISADYFSNTLLVQYQNRHPETTSSWKITADPRGTLTLPNAGYEVRIPCGTLAIESHLAAANLPIDALHINGSIPTTWPSLRHGARYQAVLYIEKEGFEPLLREAAIGERLDIAILSCKGQSVVAARQFVDDVCPVEGGVPLYVVHDFDKAGFEISQRLTTVSEWAEKNDRVAYQFKNKINVIDLGLRLSDVERYELGAETVQFKGGFAKDSIATPAEKKFLRSNRRVELNAFSSPQFLEWLESALSQHGLTQRLVPDDSVLVDAYRRALAIARINQKIEEATVETAKWVTSETIPKGLRRELLKVMQQNPKLPWDQVLYQLAGEVAGRRFS
jgi:hypothetical protein